MGLDSGISCRTLSTLSGKGDGAIEIDLTPQSGSLRYSGMMPGMWAWEQDDWTDWRFDLSDRFRTVAELHTAGNSLLERIADLPTMTALEVQADIVAAEACSSMAIEGVRIDWESALQAARGAVAASSLPGRKFLVPDRRAEGIALAIRNARADWDQPLTVARLCAWQRAILEASPAPGVALGRLRSGEVGIRAGDGTLRYQAPPVERIEAETARFLDWFDASRGDLPGPVRAGIAHAWFENLHPFDDGNGRVGRAVADLALSQALGGPVPALLSASIEKRRHGYYRRLEDLGRSHSNLESWLDWWLETLGSAFRKARAAVDRLETVLAAGPQLRPRQETALLQAALSGETMTARAYQETVHCSRSTAHRDLAELAAAGLIELTPNDADDCRRYRFVCSG